MDVIVVRNLGSKVLTKPDDCFQWFRNAVRLFTFRVGASGCVTAVLGHRRVFLTTLNRSRTP